MRDLSPRPPQVADFGMSGKTMSLRASRRGPPGTPLWMAPELLRRSSATTTASDVYAFGITLAEIFLRSDPYGKEDARAVLRAVAAPPPLGGAPKRPHIPAAVPPALAKLMQRCWHEVSQPPGCSALLRVAGWGQPSGPSPGSSRDAHRALELVRTLQEPSERPSMVAVAAELKALQQDAVGGVTSALAAVRTRALRLQPAVLLPSPRLAP